jgi:DNA invertase Pin-like site-specific DNA recombinase
MITTAYSYIRFSSPEQAKGDSYRRQHAAAARYCTDHGLELATAKKYTFLDKGRSAYSGRHLDDEGQLKRFLDLVENGTIERGSYLLVESLDRLSREKVSTALPRFMDLLNRGIRVVTLADGRLYTEDYNELDLIVSIVQMSRAHNESATKGDRISAAWSNKKELARTERKPLGKACPYWLELVDGQYQAIPGRVETIKLIFDLAIQGHGQGSIPRILNERSIPVFGSRNRNHSGAWGTSSVAKLLNNRALLGEYQPTHTVAGKRVSDGEPVINFFPVVIDEPVFYQAQAVRAERRIHKTGRQSERFNVFQGIMKCGTCGDAMHLVNKGRPPKGATYLQCHSARKGVCTNGYLRVERAQTILREILAKVDSLSLVQASEGQTVKELTALRGKALAVNDRLTKTAELLSEQPSSTLAEIVQRLEGELGTLRLDEQRLQERLAVNQVVSKKDFFAQLDLVTFEGRHAANSLLKRLGVLVSVSVHALYQFYSVRVEESHRFQFIHTGNGMMMLTADKAILDLRVLQGEISPAERDSWLRVIELKSNGQLSVAVDKLKSLDLSKVKFKGIPESMVERVSKTR